MPSLFIPQRKVWTSQPQIAVRVDPGLGASSAAIHTSVLATDLVTGRIPVLYGISSAPVLTVSKAGIGVKATATDYAIVPAYNISEVTGDYTLIVVASVPNLVAVQSLLDTDCFGQPEGRHLQFRVETDGRVGAIPFNTGGTPYSTYSSNSIPTGVAFVAATRLQGTQSVVFLRGVKGSPETVGGTRMTTHGLMTIAASQSGNGVDCVAGGATVYAWAVIPRALSDAQLSSITRTPQDFWGIFAPQSRSIFVGLSAGGSPSTVISASTTDVVGSLSTKTTSKVSVSASTDNAVGSLTTKTTSKVALTATTANSVGSVATKTTSKSLIIAVTSNTVGSVATKTTTKTSIATTTANSVGSILSRAGATSSISATTTNTVGSLATKTTSKSSIGTTTANAVGSLATKTTSKSSIGTTTANAVGSLATKTTSKISIGTTTANTVGSVLSGSGVASAIAATTASAVGSLGTKTTAKSLIAATTANTVCLLATKTTSKSAISASTANTAGSLLSGSGVTSTIVATTANTIGSLATKTTNKSSIGATTANTVGLLATKTTSKSAISASTANTVGSLLSGSGVTSAISATTANAVCVINGYVNGKTSIHVVLANTFSSVSSTGFLASQNSFLIVKQSSSDEKKASPTVVKIHR